MKADGSLMFILPVVWQNPVSFATQQTAISVPTYIRVLWNVLLMHKRAIATATQLRTLLIENPILCAIPLAKRIRPVLPGYFNTVLIPPVQDAGCLKWSQADTVESC